MTKTRDKNLNANLAALKKAPKHKPHKDDKGRKPILPGPASEAGSGGQGGRVEGGGATTLDNGANRAEADAKAITELARLDMLNYDRVREDAAKQLGGIQLKTLDALVKARREEIAAAVRAEDPYGAPLWQRETELWPKRVNGAELLDDIRGIIRKYIAMDSVSYTVATLWVMHAWCIDAATHNPFLRLWSPAKGCGKSTLMGLLSYFVPKPFMGTNMTVATVFRSIDAFHPTLLVDEVDTFLSEREELRGIFNAAHERRGAHVPRCTGDKLDIDVKLFSVWSPIALGGIGKIQDTIEDRSLPIKLARQLRGEERPQLPRNIEARVADIPQRCARWRDDNIEALRKAKPEIPKILRNRVRDNWWPLLAIAEECGGDWPDLAWKAALSITRKQEQQEADVKLMLLEDIRAEFVRTRGDFLTSIELAKALAERWAYEDRPWREHSRGKPITTTAIAKMLAPFDIKSERMGKSKVSGYRLGGNMQRAFDRYLKPLPKPKTGLF